MNVLIRVPIHGGGHRVIGSEHISSMRRASHAEGHGVVVILSGGERVHVVPPEDAPDEARRDPLGWLQEQVVEQVSAERAQVAAAEAIRSHQAVGQLVSQLRAATVG